MFRYGHFLNALFTFLIIAAVIFFLVIKPVNALLARRRSDPDEPTRDCPECLSEIPDGRPALRLLHRGRRACSVPQQTFCQRS